MASAMRLLLLLIATLTLFAQTPSPEALALTGARSALIKATYSEPRDNAAIQSAAEAIAAAELSLAQAGGAPRPAGRPTEYQSGGTIPNITRAQIDALTKLTTDTLPLSQSLSAARRAVSTEPQSIQAVKQAELALAYARADAFAKIQNSPNHLSPDQVAAFIKLGGSFANFAFTLPDPYNFADHEGYVSLFDGATLKGWDGNPKFWRVENGAIIGESTPQNPSGNSYLVYKDMIAKDFTLKFEIKVEGSGGSGFQYRSQTGKPWLANIAPNVTANVGPVNLNWMLTGPQADFWPSARDWTGQFYSENTPMRILAWRGQVVEGSGLAKKQLMGTIGDRAQLGTLVKKDDWNEYIVIARGGTFIQIVNGQLMAVMVDDDPESSNNQPGFFGIEIEATTKVSVRNIWVKKF
jgi:hypothetical protein